MDDKITLKLSEKDISWLASHLEWFEEHKILDYDVDERTIMGRIGSELLSCRLPDAYLEEWVEIYCTNDNCNRQDEKPDEYMGFILNRPLAGCYFCGGAGTIKIKKELFNPKKQKLYEKVA